MFTFCELDFSFYLKKKSISIGIGLKRVLSEYCLPIQNAWSAFDMIIFLMIILVTKFLSDWKKEWDMQIIIIIILKKQANKQKPTHVWSSPYILYGHKAFAKHLVNSNSRLQ